MAKIIGGLHGRPAGNVGGIIYGAARSRAGKVVTARELVIPANPQTAAQQNQRDKFRSCLLTTRGWGPDYYADNWNRSVGQLPGFHSVESLLLHSINDENLYDDPPPVTPLGTLHFPDTFDVTTGASGVVMWSWSGELGDNGAAADEVEGGVIEAGPDADLDHYVEFWSPPKVRSGLTGTITGLKPGVDYLTVSWLRSTLLGTAHLSTASWTIATAGA